MKTCIVCGELFKPIRTTQICCSEGCRKERMQQTCKEWQALHPEAKAKYYQHAQEKKKTESVKPENEKVAVITANQVAKLNPVKAKWSDPKWIKDYSNADRLTKISMLARALSDLGIEQLTYGTLSIWWDTDRYASWEKQVLRLKRAE